MGRDSPALRPSVRRMGPFRVVLLVVLVEVVIIPVAQDRMKVCSLVDKERRPVSSRRGVYVVLADDILCYCINQCIGMGMFDLFIGIYWHTIMLGMCDLLFRCSVCILFVSFSLKIPHHEPTIFGFEIPNHTWIVLWKKVLRNGF